MPVQIQTAESKFWSRFELEEERALWAVYQAAAKQIRRDMSIPDFLQVRYIPCNVVCIPMMQDGRF